MKKFLSFLMPLMALFANITSAVSGAQPGYVQLDQAVRDYYSREVLFQAQPRLRFLQFAKQKEDLTAVRGKSIVFTKYGNLAGGGALLEHENINISGMSTSEIQIAVTEQGNAVKVTEFLLQTSLLDVLGDASKLLANNLAVVLDSQFRDTVLQATATVFGGQGTADPPTTFATLADGDGLDTATVKDAVEILATNDATKILGEYYVCIAHPHQLRQLRDDKDWIEANKYMGRRQLYTGEVGMYEGTIFIETTQMPEHTAAQLNTKYELAGVDVFAGTKAWEAVIFGENAYAWAVALPVELRDDGVVDLGRKHVLGWYGIWGTGIVEDANIVKIITA